MADYGFLNGVNGDRDQGHDYHTQMKKGSPRVLVALDPTGRAVEVNGRLIRQVFGASPRTFVDGSDVPFAEEDLGPAMRDAAESRRCPTCGSALVSRRSTSGKFYGCETYVVGAPPVPFVNCVTKIFIPERRMRQR